MAYFPPFNVMHEVLIGKEDMDVEKTPYQCWRNLIMKSIMCCAELLTIDYPFKPFPPAVCLQTVFVKGLASFFCEICFLFPGYNSNAVRYFLFLNFIYSIFICILYYILLYYFLILLIFCDYQTLFILILKAELFIRFARRNAIRRTSLRWWGSDYFTPHWPWWFSPFSLVGFYFYMTAELKDLECMQINSVPFCVGGPEYITPRGGSCLRCICPHAVAFSSGLEN